jgi:hypothetical protein
MLTSPATRRAVRAASVLAAVAGLSVSGLSSGPASAAARPQGVSIAVFTYYGDVNLDQAIGGRTIDTCPGGSDSAWGVQSAWYTVQIEPCS